MSKKCQGEKGDAKAFIEQAVCFVSVFKKQGPGTVSIAPGLAEGKSAAGSSFAVWTRVSRRSKGFVENNITLFYVIVNIFCC